MNEIEGDNNGRNLVNEKRKDGLQANLQLENLLMGAITEIARLQEENARLRGIYREKPSPLNAILEDSTPSSSDIEIPATLVAKKPNKLKKPKKIKKKEASNVNFNSAPPNKPLNKPPLYRSLNNTSFHANPKPIKKLRKMQKPKEQPQAETKPKKNKRKASPVSSNIKIAANLVFTSTTMENQIDNATKSLQIKTNDEENEKMKNMSVQVVFKAKREMLKKQVEYFQAQLNSDVKKMLAKARHEMHKVASLKEKYLTIENAIQKLREEVCAPDKIIEKGKASLSPIDKDKMKPEPSRRARSHDKKDFNNDNMIVMFRKF